MSTTFNARGDSGPAANSAINSMSIYETITFVNTDVEGNPGDYTLERPDTSDPITGFQDPDTAVSIGGELYSFTLELTTVLQTGNGSGSGIYGGEQVVVITVHGYAADGSDQRFYFLPNVPDADMTEFSNGAVKTNSEDDNYDPPDVEPCFVRGTLIRTPDGDIPVESLKAGDKVVTASGQEREIRWISSSRVNAFHMLQNPENRPICIPTGAFGQGAPFQDLWISARHRVVLSGYHVEVLFGEDKVFVAAQDLHIEAASRVRPAISELEYFHVLLDSHDILISNGLETESFMPGDGAQYAITNEQRVQLDAAFPQYADDWAKYGPTALRTIGRTEALVYWAHTPALRRMDQATALNA